MSSVSLVKPNAQHVPAPLTFRETISLQRESRRELAGLRRRIGYYK